MVGSVLLTLSRLTVPGRFCYHSIMTLEERLALAREIAARTTPRFVVDKEARQKRFAEAKRYTDRHRRANLLKR